MHEYFVDGSPEVQDVCTTAHGAAQTCGGWATYLAGTLGAGGHGVYMLDVTSPSTFTEANAQSIVKWEFTDADDRDLGNSPGTPLIRRMANGKWAVIVSGGYNNSAADGNASTTGHGVIFILFTSGPTGASGTWTPNVDYIKLTTATGTVATPNGLAQPFSADINTDGIIDFLYAGDLLGNFWKFDVRDTAGTNWTNAANRVTLFQARDASNNVQPITAPAEGTSHVTGTGFMINFGTGKYLENTDVTPPGTGPYLTQSYYGIWDKNDNASVSLQTTAARSELQVQQVLAHVTTAVGTARVVSDNAPNWTDTASPPLHKGWLLDFPAATPPALTPTTGERAVFQPTLINGRLIFTTLVPSTQTCASGGQSFLMVLDNMTGGRFIQSPFDTSGDGTINSSDLVTVPGVGTVAVSGVATGVGAGGGIAGTPTVIKAGAGVGGQASSGTPQYAGGTSGMRGDDGRQQLLGGVSQLVDRDRDQRAARPRLQLARAVELARNHGGLNARGRGGYGQAARIHSDRADDRGRGNRDHRGRRLPVVHGIRQPRQARRRQVRADAGGAADGALLQPQQLLPQQHRCL